VWSASISTPRYRNISECSHPVHLVFRATQTSSSDFNGFGCTISNALCELTASTSFLGPRAVFLPPRAMHTRLQSTCGSKHSVRLHSISYSPNGSNFISRFTLSFFGISISPIPPLDLLLEKLHRNHDLARIRAIGGSAQVSASFLLLIPLPPIHLTHFTARSCLVESKRGSQFGRTGFSPQSQQSAHITMFLDT
jgi:hypothetical protein